MAFVRSALFERYGTLIACVTLMIGDCWALWGTYSGTWAWALYWPSWGHLAQANPPSDIAAGYCFLDTIALFGAPILARFLKYCRTAFRRLQPVPVRVRPSRPARDTG